MSFDEDIRRIERDGKAADYKAILFAKTLTKREPAFLQADNDALKIAMLETAAKRAMQRRVQKKMDWASKVQAFRRGERLPHRAAVKHLINSATEMKQEAQEKIERPRAGIINNPQENELATLRTVLDNLQSHVARQDRTIAELQLRAHLPNPTSASTTTTITSITALEQQQAKVETNNNSFVRRMDRIRATSAALQAHVADMTDSVFPDVTTSMQRLVGAVTALEVKALACGYGGLANEVRALKVALALHSNKLDGRF